MSGESKTTFLSFYFSCHSILYTCTSLFCDSLSQFHFKRVKASVKTVVAFQYNLLSFSQRVLLFDENFCSGATKIKQFDMDALSLQCKKKRVKTYLTVYARLHYAESSLEIVKKCKRDWTWCSSSKQTSINRYILPCGLKQVFRCTFQIHSLSAHVWMNPVVYVCLFVCLNCLTKIENIAKENLCMFFI